MKDVIFHLISFGEGAYLLIYHVYNL